MTKPRQWQIGDLALLDTGQFSLPVRVTGVRSAFGRLDVQVEPVRGTGVIWTWASKLRPMDEQPTPAEQPSTAVNLETNKSQ